MTPTNLGSLFTQPHVLGPITVVDTADFGLPWHAIGPGPVVRPPAADEPLAGRVLDPTETGPLTLASAVREP